MLLQGADGDEALHGRDQARLQGRQVPRVCASMGELRGSLPGTPSSLASGYMECWGSTLAICIFNLQLRIHGYMGIVWLPFVSKVNGNSLQK